MNVVCELKSIVCLVFLSLQSSLGIGSNYDKDFFSNWKKNPTWTTGGCFGVRITYLLSLDNPLHPSVSAYLSVELGVVLIILPDTVIVESNRWIFVQYSTCTKVVYYLHCRSSYLSHTHLRLKDCNEHFGLGKLSNFCRTQIFVVVASFISCFLHFNSEYSPVL